MSIIGMMYVLSHVDWKFKMMVKHLPERQITETRLKSYSVRNKL